MCKHGATLINRLEMDEGMCLGHSLDLIASGKDSPEDVGFSLSRPELEKAYKIWIKNT